MDICFVQMSLTGCSVVILQKVENQLGVQCYLHTNKLKVEELPDAITQKSPNLSMIVVDGINQKTFQKLVTLATTVAETQSKKTITCQIIFVTSQRVDFTKKHQMGSQLEQRLKTIDPQPVSWTLDEYKIACANKELWSQIAKTLGDNDQVEYSEEVLKEKFFYCGGSARWMFNFTIEDITNTIDTKVEELFNFTSVLSGSAGMSSQLAVNTLYQQFRGSSSSQRINFFISEYAMRRIVERVGDEAANFMWNWATASNHPPVKGLAYEGKCMAAWKNTAMSLNLIYLDKVTTRVITPRKRVPQVKVVISKGRTQSILRLDAKGCLDTANLAQGSTDIMIIPEKWNQECFDFVFIQDKDLYCAQCTLQSSHSRSLGAIGKLVKACQENQIVVGNIHLVALTDQTEFKFHHPLNFAQEIKEILCWWAKCDV
jgi:hypothetical protein